MFGCQTWQELWKVENHWITHLLISCPWPHYTKNKIDLLIVTFITEYSLAPVYGQPHFALAPTHSPTRFPSPGFPNLFSLLLIHHTCSHPSVLIPLFTLHGTLISGFYYPLFSSSSLPSPARTPPSFLISLFLSLRFYLCLFLSSTSFFFFFFIPIMVYSYFGRKLFSDHTPPDGTLPLQLLYTSLPYLFSSYPCSYQKICICIFFLSLCLLMLTIILKTAEIFYLLFTDERFVPFHRAVVTAGNMGGEKISHLGFDLRGLSYWNA